MSQNMKNPPIIFFFHGQQFLITIRSLALVDKDYVVEAEVTRFNLRQNFFEISKLNVTNVTKMHCIEKFEVLRSASDFFGPFLNMLFELVDAKR